MTKVKDHFYKDYCLKLEFVNPSNYQEKNSFAPSGPVNVIYASTDNIGVLKNLFSKKDARKIKLDIDATPFKSSTEIVPAILGINDLNWTNNFEVNFGDLFLKSDNFVENEEVLKVLVRDLIKNFQISPGIFKGSEVVSEELYFKLQAFFFLINKSEYILWFENPYISIDYFIQKIPKKYIGSSKTVIVCSEFGGKLDKLTEFRLNIGSEDSIDHKKKLFNPNKNINKDPRKNQNVVEKYLHLLQKSISKKIEMYGYNDFLKNNSKLVDRFLGGINWKPINRMSNEENCSFLYFPKRCSSKIAIDIEKLISLPNTDSNSALIILIDDDSHLSFVEGCLGKTRKYTTKNIGIISSFRCKISYQNYNRVDNPSNKDNYYHNKYFYCGYETKFDYIIAELGYIDTNRNLKVWQSKKAAFNGIQVCIGGSSEKVVNLISVDSINETNTFLLECKYIWCQGDSSNFVQKIEKEYKTAFQINNKWMDFSSKFLLNSNNEESEFFNGWLILNFSKRMGLNEDNSILWISRNLLNINLDAFPVEFISDLEIFLLDQLTGK